MSDRPDDLIFIGLTLSSSWGNGHATTYRALLQGLAGMNQRLLFLERDVPWYAANRDLPAPDFCDFALYNSLEHLQDRFGSRIARAGAVIVGSYVPDGVAVLDFVLEHARGAKAFYDIDTPVTMAALDDDAGTYLARRQIPEVDLYLSFTGGPTLDRLRQEFGARRPHALYCAVNETLYRPVDIAPRWDLGYLGTYSPDRQPTLDRLLLQPARRLPQLRFVVAGPQYPSEIKWPANVERIEHLAPADHAAFYGAQRFTLNVTRAAMIAAGWSPSVRIFEAASCGTPIISDRWAGLTDLLAEGEAVLIADNSDAVVATLTGMTESARHQVGQRARSIVRAGHTGAARAAELLRYISEAKSAAQQTRSYVAGS